MGEDFGALVIKLLCGIPAHCIECRGRQHQSVIECAFKIGHIKRSAAELGKGTVCVFHRSVAQSKILDAMTIATSVIVLSVFGSIFISATSPVSFTDGLYESVSALATVGLTAGATGKLSVAAQLLIMIYMYFGRVGVLTISLGFLMGNKAQERFRYAYTNLLIG